MQDFSHDFSLYNDIMETQAKFSDVLTTKGAWEFNEAFETPLVQSDEANPLLLGAEIIDATLRKSTDWFGVESSSIEYLVKIHILADPSQICIIGKRFSEIGQLHQTVLDLDLVSKEGAPPFPDKNDLHENWWLLSDKDPSSEFVKQRVAVLGAYFSRLFQENSELPFHPSVMEFFNTHKLCASAKLIYSQSKLKSTRYNRHPKFATTTSDVVSEHVRSHVQSRSDHVSMHHFGGRCPPEASIEDPAKNTENPSSIIYEV